MTTFRKLIKSFEAAFEAFLFNCRFLVLIAVVGSLVASILMFLNGGQKVYKGIVMFMGDVTHAAAETAHEASELPVLLIAAVDSFLFATVLLIFSMGVYELFISDIDPASRKTDTRPNWLAIHSLDDLKNALGKVILMILIVRLFEAASQLKYEKPVDLLFLGLSVALVSLALYLIHSPKGHGEKKGQ